MTASSLLCSPATAAAQVLDSRGKVVRPVKVQHGEQAMKLVDATLQVRAQQAVHGLVWWLAGAGGPLECTAFGQRMRMLLCANCLLQALRSC